MPDAIVPTTARPDLAETTARWRWEAFARHAGRSLADVLDAERRVAATSAPMPRTLVLLAAGAPVGMASLVAHDLDERPDLTPWLAGVFVAAHARGRGRAACLVAAVETLAAASAIPTLWLYTRRAERIYARIGWRTVEAFDHRGARHALMRRDLAAEVPGPDAARDHTV